MDTQSFDEKKNTSQKPPWRDTNNGFMIHGAICRGFYQIPEIMRTTVLPMELIPFSERKSVPSSRRKEYTVHFWEHEEAYECIWRDPRRYVKFLSTFASVISPDFSMWTNMPRGQRIGNVTKSFILGAWWQRNGIAVITNVRLDDPEGAAYCLDGAPRRSVVALSTHGGVEGDRLERTLTEIKMICDTLRPRTLVVYGPDSRGVLDYPRQLGIPIDHRPAGHRRRSVERRARLASVAKGALGPGNDQSQTA